MGIEVSTVICTHNRVHYLMKTVQSLLEQSLPESRYEIIVVDNRSSDSTREAVTGFHGGNNIRYIYEANLGLANARNAGWRNAKGRYVAYIDDDAIASPMWLEKIVKVFETVRPRPGCVGGRVYPLWEAARPGWLSEELVVTLTVIDWSDAPHILRDIGREWLVGANIAFPVDILQRIGGFAAGLDRVGKNLLSGGDVFVQKQIVREGHSCFYHPEIAVSHLVPATRLRKPWFMRRYFWQGVSDAAMQIIQDRPSTARRWRSAASKALSLLRSPSDLVHLALPTNDPKRFTKKCFALIPIGHVYGLLGPAARRHDG